MYIYFWIFKEAKKPSELPWRYPFLQFHCKVVTGPVSHHCSIWPWSDLNLEFIYSAIKLPHVDSSVDIGNYVSLFIN